MKISKILVLGSFVDAKDDFAALTYLSELAEMHTDFLNSKAVTAHVKNTGKRRVSHWPDKRVTHSDINFDKLEKAFNRCGSENYSYTRRSGLSTDVCQAANEILSAISQWAKAHLSGCKSIQAIQKHTDRMDKKWSNIYNKVLGCTEAESAEVESVEATNPNTHEFCYILDTWTSNCTDCYTYVHKDEDDKLYDYDLYGYLKSDDEFSCEFTISNACDPNFHNRNGNDCDWYNFDSVLNSWSNDMILEGGVMTDKGFMTALNCPQMGCDENGPIRFDERNKSRR